MVEMAAVLSSCPSRRNKSQEETTKLKARGSNRPVSAPPEHKKSEKLDVDAQNYVQELLSRLPPSSELMQHYQAKLAQYEKEEKELSVRIAACAQLLDNSNRLEKELAQRDSDIERLHCTIEEAGMRFHKERKKVLQLGAENDRLRIRDIENQQKIAVLASLCGKTDSELMNLVNQTSIPSIRSQEGSDKISKFRERSKLKERRSPHSLELEVEHLEQQLVEQEKLHREQLVEEKKSRKAVENTYQTDKAALRTKISELQNSTAAFENHLQVITTELTKTRNLHRKTENSWCSEKAVLLRKLQFVNKFGTLEGTHTGHRAKARLKGQGQPLARQEQELAAKEKELESYRSQMLQLQDQMEAERLKSEAAAQILARKTKSMAEQVSILTERAERSEVRRARESEGYQADIRLLRQKMSQLESKLVSLTSACLQERNSEEAIKKLGQQLEMVEKSKPRQWKD